MLTPACSTASGRLFGMKGTLHTQGLLSGRNLTLPQFLEALPWHYSSHPDGYVRQHLYPPSVTIEFSANRNSEAPKRAVKFSANDEWGKFYRTAFGQEKMNQSLSVLTGASAGATEAFVVVPFELVKIRLQDKASAGKYSGMLDVVAKSKCSNPPPDDNSHHWLLTDIPSQPFATRVSWQCTMD